MPFVVTSSAPKVHRASGSGRGAYWLFRLFSRHISRTQSFQENHPFSFQVRVALKALVSLIDRLVACSVRISVDRHTDKVTLDAHAPRRLWAEYEMARWITLLCVQLRILLLLH